MVNGVREFAQSAHKCLYSNSYNTNCINPCEPLKQTPLGRDTCSRTARCVFATGLLYNPAKEGRCALHNPTLTHPICAGQTPTHATHDCLLAISRQCTKSTMSCSSCSVGCGRPCAQPAGTSLSCRLPHFANEACRCRQDLARNRQRPISAELGPESANIAKSWPGDPLSAPRSARIRETLGCRVGSKLVRGVPNVAQICHVWHRSFLRTDAVWREHCFAENQQLPP